MMPPWTQVDPLGWPLIMVLGPNFGKLFISLKLMELGRSNLTLMTLPGRWGVQRRSAIRTSVHCIYSAKSSSVSLWYLCWFWFCGYVWKTIYVTSRSGILISSWISCSLSKQLCCDDNTGLGVGLRWLVLSKGSFYTLIVLGVQTAIAHCFVLR